MDEFRLMGTALAVSAVLLGLWQLTLPAEERFDPTWERYGSAAGLAFFVVAAVAVKFLRG